MHRLAKSGTPVVSRADVAAVGSRTDDAFSEGGVGTSSAVGEGKSLSLLIWVRGPSLSLPSGEGVGLRPGERLRAPELERERLPRERRRDRLPLLWPFLPVLLPLPRRRLPRLSVLSDSELRPLSEREHDGAWRRVLRPPRLPERLRWL